MLFQSKKALTIICFFFIFFGGLQAGYSQNSPVKSGYIQAGQLRLYFERHGKGEPLLFLHAGFLNHKMWAAQVDCFRKTNEVIVLDFPGHGLSSGKDTNYLITNALSVVLDSLQLPRVSLIGLSIGSGVALEFALTFPQRVSKLIMIAPSLPGMEKKYPIDSRTLDFFTNMMAHIAQGDTAMAAELYTRFWFDGLQRQPHQSPQQPRQEVYQYTYQNMLMHRIQGWPRFNQANTAFDRLETLSVPLLIIIGSLDAPSCINVANYLSTTVKEAKRVDMEGAAHMINMEYPTLVNEQIAQFIQTNRQP